MTKEIFNGCVLVCLVALVFFCPLPCIPEDAGRKLLIEPDLMLLLKSVEPVVRQDAFDAVRKKRLQLESQLLEIAKAHRSTADREVFSTWSLAVKMLGDMRSREAVPYLILELATEVPVILLSADIIAPFPCAGALISIGVPAINPVLFRIEEESTLKELVLLAYVVKAVLGTDLALKRLDIEMNRTNLRRRENFDVVLEIVTSRDFGKYFERIWIEEQKQKKRN